MDANHICGRGGSFKSNNTGDSKMVYENKESIEYAMESLEEKLNNPHVSNKERKVINACLRCYKLRLKKFKKAEK